MNTILPVLCLKAPLPPGAICTLRVLNSASVVQAVSGFYIFKAVRAAAHHMWEKQMAVCCSQVQLEISSGSPSFLSLQDTVKPVWMTWSAIAHGRSRAMDPLTASQWATTRTSSPSAASVMSCRRHACSAIGLLPQNL